ncbi:60S acidic ribosomal protein P1-like isoform X1 [Punica granatum]|uniref:60S acidic ribosomal protein P1-like isoform X1 n=1 Tax=Punica granatum TaxID=22663 RepID=A0A6P8C0U5_PUNGR|nr:60S acidic ribosomal protein P1-like isoform X1 [Punica granatum]XP_031376885.1 60S acidic ribosomal protein P1-like isoform X1 [Punica granatum]
MAAGELACTYAALILFDDGIPITAEKISTLVKAANVNIESFWPGLFAKLFEKKSIEDLILTSGSDLEIAGGASVAAAAPAAGAGAPAAAPAAATEEEKKEEPKAESEDEEDFGFDLFA